MRKRLAFDLDGVLCEELPHTERMFAAPLTRAREVMNLAYARGHYVVVYTARHWNEHRMTEEWLRKNGFNFHQLICGKYPYDRLLDDRALNEVIEMESYVRSLPTASP